MVQTAPARKSFADWSATAPAGVADTVAFTKPTFRCGRSPSITSQWNSASSLFSRAQLWELVFRENRRDALFHYREQHAGLDDPANLAWACQPCNLLKGTNLSATHPDSMQVARVFHPRTERWEDHFTIERDRIVSLTPTGRATVWLLQMNTAERMALRAELRAIDRWPPTTR